MVHRISSRFKITDQAKPDCSRNVHERLTFLATIELKPQCNVTLPSLGMNTDVPGDDSRFKNVAYDLISFCVATECLDKCENEKHKFVND